MNTYEKDLRGRVLTMANNAQDMFDMLLAIGVIDEGRLRILAVREYVNDLLGAGHKKVEAMWIASEIFCCSYEYIRKCVYYYKDINL